MASKYENLMDDGTRNIVRSFYDNFARDNAAVREKAGFRMTVIRESIGTCCDWCSEREGIYDYDSVSSDVWQRHKNCTCIVTTKTERGTYQDAWSRKEYSSHQEARIARTQEIVEEIKKNDKITVQERLERIKQAQDALKDVHFTDKNGNVIIGNRKQIGTKCGKHAHEFGLDQSTAEGRREFEALTSDILQNSEEIRYGDWRMQEGLCEFHIKGADVVVTNHGNYVTTLKGGINNARVKNARR